MGKNYIACAFRLYRFHLCSFVSGLLWPLSDTFMGTVPSRKQESQYKSPSQPRHFMVASSEQISHINTTHKERAKGPGVYHTNVAFGLRLVVLTDLG